MSRENYSSSSSSHPNQSYRYTQSSYYAPGGVSSHVGYTHNQIPAQYSEHHHLAASSQQPLAYAQQPRSPSYQSSSAYAAVVPQAYHGPMHQGHPVVPSQTGYAQHTSQGYHGGYSTQPYASSSPPHSSASGMPAYGSPTSPSSSSASRGTNVCDLCGKDFSRRHDMQRHKDSHHGDTTHLCPYCGKGYARSDTLKRHIDTPCASAPAKKDSNDKKSPRSGRSGRDASAAGAA